jgi:hypothetical protein
MLYRLPFLVYAAMSGEKLFHKLGVIRATGWKVYCANISYTSRCEVFVTPGSERVSCKALEAVSNNMITVDCYGRYERV